MVFYMAKGDFADIIKDLEKGEYPGLFTSVLVRGRQREIWLQKSRRQYNQKQDWSDTATNQGVPAATQSWKRWEMHSPLGSLERAQPDNTLKFIFGIYWKEYQWYWFWTPGLQNCRKNIFKPPSGCKSPRLWNFLFVATN